MFINAVTTDSRNHTENCSNFNKHEHKLKTFDCSQEPSQLWIPSMRAALFFLQVPLFITQKPLALQNRTWVILYSSMSHLKATKASKCLDGGGTLFPSANNGCIFRGLENTWASCTLFSLGRWGQLSLFNPNLLEGDNNQTCVQHPESSGDVLSLPSIHLSSQPSPDVVFPLLELVQDVWTRSIQSITEGGGWQSDRHWGGTVTEQFTLMAEAFL